MTDVQTAWAIDATNWCHVFWHASGQRECVPAFLHRLEQVRDQFRPDVMHACFDAPPSFRHALCANYKAGRKETPDELKRQLREAESRCPDWCMPLSADGYEADDGLANVAAWVEARPDWRCVLATGDKDARQCLVDGQVTICRDLKSDRGRLIPTWYTAQDLLREYGLRPDQWVDYQTLAGDGADSVGGCKGIGPKTAGPLLKHRGTLAAILADPWQCRVTESQRRALFAFRKEADTVQKLVRLVRDISVIRGAI